MQTEPTSAPAGRARRGQRQPGGLATFTLLSALVLAACGGANNGSESTAGGGTATAPAPSGGTAPGTTPAPAPGATPAPAPGTTPAPAPGTTPPATSVGEGIAAGGLKRTRSGNADPAFAELLKHWRKPDASGLACANCHAPDGIDLALLKFDDTTIRRRASPHVDAATVEGVVKFINLVRKVNNITAPKDPIEFRPFQPGGKVLPGATFAERDYNYQLELRKSLPTLGSGRIDTVEKAYKAKAELMAYNPRKHPIGIPFPRWAEDGFHGPAHATVNDWVPERPQVGKTPADNAALFALHDAYINDPSPQNLWAIQNAYGKITQAAVFPDEVGRTLTDGAKSWSGTKQSAMMFGQHLLRMEHQGLDDSAARLGLPIMNSPTNEAFDPFFGLGNFGNHSVIGPTDIPSGFLAGLRPESRTPDGFGRMLATEGLLVEWWVLGWTFTPALTHTANWYEYFVQSIGGGRNSGQTMPTHQALIAWVMAMHRTFTPQLDRQGGAALLKHLFALNAPGSPGPDLAQVDYWGNRVWHNADHRDGYVTLTNNFIRMVMLLQIGETQAQCAAGGFKQGVIGGDERREYFLRTRWQPAAAVADPANAAFDRDLVNRGMLAYEQSRNGCVMPVESNGTGPTVRFYSDATLSVPIPSTWAPNNDRFAVYSSGCNVLNNAPAGTVFQRGGSGYAFGTFLIEGRVVPRFTGPHYFAVGNFSGNHFTLTVNGQVVNQSGGRAVPIQLTAGQEVSYRALTSAEFNCAAGGGNIELTWSANNDWSSYIPITSLRAP
jgi:hypothetical protein